jgi:plasmid stabilization system protein ParE
MRFTVVWSREAEAELTEIWLGGGDRNAIRAAADSIGRLLRDEPGRNGEPYEDGRAWIVPPLVVVFRVDE